MNLINQEKLSHHCKVQSQLNVQLRFTHQLSLNTMQNKYLLKKQRKFSKLFSRFSVSLGMGLLTTLCAIPAFGAERIAFSSPPFGEFYVSVKDLEIFAKEGRITPSLGFYTKRLNPEQQASLRDLLNRRLQLNQVSMGQLVYSPIGKRVLQELTPLFKNSSPDITFNFLRAALIQAAADPEGVSVLNVVRQYPADTLTVDREHLLQAVDEASKLVEDKNLIIAALQQEATTEATAKGLVNASAQQNLALPGLYKWRKESLSFTNPSRQHSINADVYLPTNITAPAPVIVIAPGLGSNLTTFAYLAEHLASYGFGVIIVDFPSSDTRRIRQFLAGLNTAPKPSEWVEQPKDVTYLLNELERKSQSEPAWQGQLNLKQVGVLGQSLGGYTVLALGGAQVKWQALKQSCAKVDRADEFSFNLSLLWQCADAQSFNPSPDLHDKRVSAVLAVNPLSNPVFGQQGMSQMQVPVMLVSGSADYLTPPVPEQILPFTWLTNPDKYLVLVKNSTHFSFVSGDGLPLPKGLVGPNPGVARSYLKALSVAFFRTHLTHQPEFAAYLSESYLKSISQEPLPLSLVRSLTEAQVEKAARGNQENQQ